MATDSTGTHRSEISSIADQGERSGDTPIRDILPDYYDYLFADPWIADHVTLRDILTHRTGVERSFDELWIANAFNRSSIIKYVQYR